MKPGKLVEAIDQITELVAEHDGKRLDDATRARLDELLGQFEAARANEIRVPFPRDKDAYGPAEIPFKATGRRSIKVFATDIWLSKMRQMRADAVNRAEPIKLSESDINVLALLANEEEVLIRSAEIAFRINASTKTVNAVLAKLRNAGLVARPEGERSGNAITAAGRAALGRV